MSAVMYALEKVRQAFYILQTDFQRANLALEELHQALGKKEYQTKECQTIEESPTPTIEEPASASDPPSMDEYIYDESMVEPPSEVEPIDQGTPKKETTEEERKLKQMAEARAAYWKRKAKIHAMELEVQRYKQKEGDEPLEPIYKGPSRKYKTEEERKEGKKKTDRMAYERRRARQQAMKIELPRYREKEQQNQQPK